MPVVRNIAAFVLALTLTPLCHADIGSPVPKRQVALYSGKMYPLDQFWLAFPDVCPLFHVHAASGGVITAFDGTQVTDPMPGACGYGPLGAFFIGEAYETALPDADFDGIPDSVDPTPNNPDGDGDGIPDGSEDVDGDGLTFGDEFWVTRSNPLVIDTDGSGFDDKLSYILRSTAREFTKIPLVINLYRGSGATEAHAREAMVLANSVLKQARLMYVLARINTDVTTGDDGSDGGTAEDGRFTDGENRNVTNAGLREVRNLSGRKGFKVTYAQAGGGVLVGSTTPGLSYHRFGSVTCEQRTSTALTAATLAHEMFHVLTLDHPADGTPEDTPGNIMTPSNAGRDEFVNSPDPDKGLANVTLTPGQIAQIQADGVIPNLGRTGTRRSPAQKKQYEIGLEVDAVGDQSAGQPDYLDLLMINANADEDRTDVLLMLSLNGRIPASGAFQAVFRLLVDADNNVGTGATVAGMPGVDRDIQVLAVRSATGPLELLTRKLEQPSGVRQALSSTPLIRPVTRRGGEGTLPEMVFSDLIEFRVAKSAFAFGADQVPITVISQASEFGAVVDSLAFVYNRTQYLDDPTMSVDRESALAGTSIDFTLSGLTPNESFELSIDDSVLLSDFLDGSGGFSGSVMLPTTLADDFYFLWAQDAQNEFAFSGMDVGVRVFGDGFE